MTHGDLEIMQLGDKRKRAVKLHTFHTGMDIPLAVEGAIDVFRAKWQMNFGRAWDREIERGKIYTRERLYRDLCSGLYFTAFDYPPDAAALIIAAMPGLLLPVNGGWEKDGYPAKGFVA